MAIDYKFDINQLFEELGAEITPILQQVLVEVMQKTCLEIIILAKQLDTYKDQTNALRSSLGYIIYDSGQKVAEYFQASGTGDGAGAAAGIEKGKQAAQAAAAEYPDDIIGVMVAGEDYALCVESKGFDVLSGPASQMKTIFEKNLSLAFGS